MDNAARAARAVKFSIVPRVRPEGTLTCTQCHVPMDRSELRIPFVRLVCRVGSPTPPPRVLPTWLCPQCGMQQPRIEQ